MHLYVIRLKTEQLDKSHLQIFKELRSDILVNLHFIPVHFQPWYRQMGVKEGDFPESETYYNQAISIPCYPDLTNDQVDMVSENLRRIITREQLRKLLLRPICLEYRVASLC